MKTMLATLFCAFMLVGCSDDDTNPVNGNNGGNNNGGNQATNTMSVTIDGTAVEGQVYVATVAGVSNFTMTSDHYSVSITTLLTQEGSQDFGFTSYGSLTIGTNIEVLNQGNITITKYEADVIEGTFYATSPTGVQLTNGRFSVER